VSAVAFIDVPNGGTSHPAAEWHMYNKFLGVKHDAWNFRKVQVGWKQNGISHKMLGNHWTDD